MHAAAFSGFSEVPGVITLALALATALHHTGSAKHSNQHSFNVSVDYLPVGVVRLSHGYVFFVVIGPDMLEHDSLVSTEITKISATSEEHLMVLGVSELSYGLSTAERAVSPRTTLISVEVAQDLLDSSLPNHYIGGSLCSSLVPARPGVRVKPLLFDSE